MSEIFQRTLFCVGIYKDEPMLIWMIVTLNVFIFVQIPDKARVTPPSSDPKTKFYELVKVRVCVGFEKLVGNVAMLCAYGCDVSEKKS